MGMSSLLLLPRLPMPLAMSSSTDSWKHRNRQRPRPSSCRCHRRVEEGKRRPHPSSSSARRLLLLLAFFVVATGVVLLRSTTPRPPPPYGRPHHVALGVARAFPIVNVNNARRMISAPAGRKPWQHHQHPHRHHRAGNGDGPRHLACYGTCPSARSHSLYTASPSTPLRCYYHPQNHHRCRPQGRILQGTSLRSSSSATTSTADENCEDDGRMARRGGAARDEDDDDDDDHEVVVVADPLMMGVNHAAADVLTSKRVDADDDDGDELHRIRRLPVSELLDELRNRQVRFSPGAGRHELEQMLLMHRKRHKHDGGEEEGVNGYVDEDGRKDIGSGEVVSGIGAHPTVERSDAAAEAPAPAAGAPVPDVRATQFVAVNEVSSERDVERMSLTELLEELQRLGSRFAPTSTRRELEQLLLRERQRRPSQLESGVGEGAADDDELRTRRAGRADVEGASPSVSTNTRSNRRSHPVVDDLGRRQYDAVDLPRKRRKQRRRRGEASSSASSSWDWSSMVPGSVMEDAVGAARRTVRSVQRKAADMWSIDEDGIRDADFTYLYRDEDLYGRVRWLNDEPMVNVKLTSNTQYYVDDTAADDSFPTSGGGDRDSDTVDRRPVRQRRDSYESATRGERKRRSSQVPVDPGQRRERHDRRPRVRTASSMPNDLGTDRFDKDATRQRRRISPIRQGVFTKRPYLLPPARESQAVATNATSSSTFPAASPKAPSERKIYSPYNDRDRFDEVGEGLDRFGKFVADVADRFMWGPNEDGSDRRDGVTGSAEDPSAVDPTTEASNGSRPKGTYRHWKDRLEAQFDSVLGIGEEGEYYRRWADKARHDKRNEGGNDPFSVARGVQPKRRGLSSPHNRNRRYDKPIWEEEGNLVSLLFGRTQSGTSLLFEKLLDPNHGSLLFLLQAVFRSFLLVSSYVCRWASVRGAFPQPIVVIGVFSAAVCAPRRRRLWAVGLALIFFRALGELAHGYAYGNDGWEDDAPDAEEESDSSDDGR